MENELTKIVRLLQNQSDEVKWAARAIILTLIYRQHTQTKHKSTLTNTRHFWESRKPGRALVIGE